MRITSWSGVVAVVVVGLTTVAFAGEGTYKPTKKYKSSSGSQKLSDTPKDACLDSIAGLAKTGNKQTFVSVKSGTSDLSMTCVLRDSGNKVWDQTNAVSILTKCNDGTDSKSGDNSGTLASQVCACDPVKGCPVEPDSCAAGDAADSCEAEKSPPAPDRTARCQQQPAPPSTSKRAAANRSATNIRATQKDTELVAKYNAAKLEVQKRQLADKQRIHGSKLKTNGFPEFDPKDLYPDGPNDINIGKLCGSDAGDFAAANNVAGYGSTPVGADGTKYTWHHHEELGRFQLVRSDRHGAFDARHWGGRAIWKRAFEITEYPKCCPKKKK